MIRVRNVVLYGSTSSCTLVTVPLSVNFTCLKLAAHRMTTGQETRLYLRVSSCQAMRPLPLEVGPATQWYKNDEPREALRMVVVCPPYDRHCPTRYTHCLYSAPPLKSKLLYCVETGFLSGTY